MAKKNDIGIWGWLALGGLGLGLWLRARAGKVAIETPTIPFQQIATDGLRLTIMLPVVNGSGFAVTLQDFVGHLRDGQGQNLAFINLPARVKIPEFGRIEIPFETRISWTSIAIELVDIIKSAKGIDPKQYRLVGQLRVTGGFIIQIDTPLL